MEYENIKIGIIGNPQKKDMKTLLSMIEEIEGKSKKVFLYLYPIQEYTNMFLLDDETCDEWNIKKPLPILNECIQKRYRDNAYQVVFVLYPDKDIFGIIPKEEDRIIYTDTLFSESSAIDENRKEKKDFIPKYPDEQLLLEQLGNVEHLVVGGYHYSSCVKRMVETALNNGIDTLIDLDMTDLFFRLYRDEDYFDIEEYSPKRYREYILNKNGACGREFAERRFNRMYSSSAYGFGDNDCKKIK